MSGIEEASGVAVERWKDSQALTTDATVTAAVIGIPLSSLYALCRQGKSPIEPIRCGRTLRFRSDQLRELVGI